jgi:hypothetical protein
VTGATAVNSLSVTGSAVIGSDLVISQINSGDSLSTTFDTVNAPLSIQSSGSQPLYLMAGLVQIDTLGNVQIAGDLNVSGQIASSGVTVQESESGFAKLLSLQNREGEEVAGITASGSATFKSVAASQFAVADDPNATSSSSLAGFVFESTATAGSAKVPAGTDEVIIANPNIKANSLLFVTPTSGTGNYVIYVKEQLDGQARIGFDQTTESDINFNWWIVGLTASNQ